MDNNDFDIDFDFEKEYGFDPKLFMDTNEEEQEPDPAVDDGHTPEELPVEGEGDFDLDSILGETEDPGEDPVPVEGNFGEDFQENDDGEADFPDPDSFGDYDLDDMNGQDKAEEEEDIPIRRRSRTFREEIPQEEPESEETDAEEFGEEVQQPDDVDQGEWEENESIRRRERKPRERKPKTPSVFSKLLDLYLEPLHRTGGEEVVDSSGRTRRRRKPTKAQIFKEVYLPAIIAGVALVMILTFIVGSVTNAVKRKEHSDKVKQQESIKASEDAAQAEAEYNSLLEEADRLAAGYDYEAAIEKLNGFTGTDAEHTQQITAKKAEYANAQSGLVEWKDVSQIPNLSFHVLIADMARAQGNTELKGQYNKNFVTIDEFTKILDQLYAADYVLVDYDSWLGSSVGVDGKETYFVQSMMLPANKKPVMITETMVNYFDYMIDSNKDGTPDANGDGFACRLVVDANGDIKAEYVDGSGQTLVGNYDLVPLLEDFIKQHPDFSYRGARATLAVTGDQGIFGYRCNTSYISSVSQSYYDEQLAGAKTIVQALNEKGYTFASYTYGNKNYRDLSAAQIQEEMRNWTNYVMPAFGDIKVKIMVFAREHGITDYSGAGFTAMSDAGFRIFVDQAEKPSVDTGNSSYVKQNRLMVTGKNMAWHTSMFTGLFDCNVVMDTALRGNVPNDG